MASDVTIGVPAYGGVVHSGFAQGLYGLLNALQARGVSAAVHWICNESLIPRARNHIASEFTDGGGQVLQFIDADLEFDPVALADQIGDTLSGNGPLVSGGVYPAKGYKPSRLAEAAKAGLTGQDLMNAGLVYVTQYGKHAGGRSSDGTQVVGSGDEVEAWFLDSRVYVRAEYLPTGLLTVHRKVFDLLLQGATGVPAVERYRAAQGGGTHYNLFPTPVLSGAADSGGVGKLLSEDYGFCHLAGQHGVEMWSNITNKAAHWGTHRFGEP